MHEHYAESVAISGMSRDAENAFSVRLGRFPPRGTGTLWISAYVGGTHYAVADAGLSLAARGATPIDEASAQFEVSGTSRARFESFERHTRRMHGWVIAESMAHRTSHPEPGPGDKPITLQGEFRVSHPPVQVRPGRMEVMGQVQATWRIGQRSHSFDVPGKWHEQTGPRPRFALAFTYLFVQGEAIGIMTSKHRKGAWGYVLENGRTTPVVAMEIDPYGSTVRRFTVTLSDGRRVSGVARVKREVSVPIEGQRRPGATVLVESDIGSMVGSLNDWNPKD